MMTSDDLIQADQEEEEKPSPGVTLKRTLRGHTGSIGRIAFSPNGQFLASPSEDCTVRLWDWNTGECVHTLKRHSDGVVTATFSKSGEILASSGNDGLIVIWNVKNGRLLHELAGHVGGAKSAAFFTDPHVVTPRDLLISSGFDGFVKIWDVDSGNLLQTHVAESSRGVAVTPNGSAFASASDSGKVILWKANGARCFLEGHIGSVFSVAFDPSGTILVSGDSKGLLKVWDVNSATLVLTLEGHTGPITSINFSEDGRYIVSFASASDGCRIWLVEEFQFVLKISEETTAGWLPGAALSPHSWLLGVVGSDPDISKNTYDRIVRIYEIDVGLGSGFSAEGTVAYTSAKIVLVGESNAGKSYLAHRMATGTSPKEGAIKSTHGMRFWPLDPNRLSPLKKVSAGQRCDVVLWDMGGQEEYRLIHQLFLHDTTLALVLFDPTRGTTAFKEVENWNKALENQLKGRAAVKLLVGTKLDRPSDTICHQSLQRLITGCGFFGILRDKLRYGSGCKGAL